MSTIYEWDVETLDAEDVLDHHHCDTYAEAVATQKAIEGQGHDTRICLVRDRHDGDTCSLEDRQWAYMENGKLPDCFEDAGGYAANRIPQRFHEEVADVS